MYDQHRLDACLADWEKQHTRVAVFIRGYRRFTKCNCRFASRLPVSLHSGFKYIRNFCRALAFAHMGLRSLACTLLSLGVRHAEGKEVEEKTIICRIDMEINTHLNPSASNAEEPDAVVAYELVEGQRCNSSCPVACQHIFKAGYTSESEIRISVNRGSTNATARCEQALA